MDSNSQNSADSQRRVYQASRMMTSGMRAGSRKPLATKDEAESVEESDRMAEEREKTARERRFKTGMKTQMVQLRAPINAKSRR